MMFISETPNSNASYEIQEYIFQINDLFKTQIFFYFHF